MQCEFEFEGAAGDGPVVNEANIFAAGPLDRQMKTIADSGATVFCSRERGDFSSITDRRVRLKGIAAAAEAPVAFYGTLKTNLWGLKHGVYYEHLPLRRVISVAQCTRAGWRFELGAGESAAFREDEKIDVREENGLYSVPFERGELFRSANADALPEAVFNLGAEPGDCVAVCGEAGGGAAGTKKLALALHKARGHFGPHHGRCAQCLEAKSGAGKASAPKTLDGAYRQKFPMGSMSLDFYGPFPALPPGWQPPRAGTCSPGRRRSARTRTSPRPARSCSQGCRGVP